MSSEESWRLTPREFDALKHVYEERHKQDYRLWAIERVEFRNAHEMFDDFRVPWQLEDMFGTGDRRTRAEKARAEKLEADFQLMKLQLGLGTITRNGAPEELLPSWGKRQWDPKDYPELFGKQ